jgi:hypothetical protein
MACYDATSLVSIAFEYTVNQGFSNYLHQSLETYESFFRSLEDSLSDLGFRKLYVPASREVFQTSLTLHHRRKRSTSQRPLVIQLACFTWRFISSLFFSFFSFLFFVLVA